MSAIPEPHRMLHPEWGYACLCKQCNKRFDSLISMSHAEAKYNRHWRRIHVKVESDDNG